MSLTNETDQISNSGDGFSLISPKVIKPARFNPPLNLGVMASGKGSNFEALVKTIIKGELDAKISLLIVNKPDCEAKDRADRMGIPCTVIDHRKYSSRDKLDEAIIKAFKDKNVEGIVMAGWMRIVTSTLINAFPNRLINIHPSLLPSFRGINAIDQALKEKVNITGCSVHIVNLKVDSGKLLIQAAVPIYKDDNKVTLTNRIQAQEHYILPTGIAIAASAWRELNIYG